MIQQESRKPQKIALIRRRIEVLKLTVEKKALQAGLFRGLTSGYWGDYILLTRPRYTSGES